MLVLLISTVIISLSVSFICSLLEACLLSISLTDIAKLSERNQFIAQLWARFKNNIQKPIAVILIINTLAHTIGAAISGAAFDELFGAKWIILFSIVYSLVMIQWTEILPKTLGVKYNTIIAVYAAFPLKILIVLFTPLIKIIQFLNKPFEMKKKESSSVDKTINDITSLVRFANINNLLSKEQADIFSRTINFTKLKAENIMVPKNDIKYLKNEMNLNEALIESHIHHHTRMPLIRNNDINDVIGYINVKDIVSTLQINPENPTLRGISRPILYIKKDDSLSVVLNKLIRNHQHISIVKNEKKEVVGLITLEDVIEEIIGNIDDEYDILPTYYYRITLTRYLVGGGCHLKELKNNISINFPDEDKLINDWLIEINGKIPKIEDRINYEGAVFIIRKMYRSRIHEIFIDLK